MIEAPIDRHLWAKSYERDLRDVLKLQDEVAQAIANEVRIKLTPQEQAQLVAAHQVDPEAQEAYLKGRFHWNKRTEKELLKAVAYFEQAIAKDPNYAAAYDGLGDSYLNLSEYGSFSSAEARSKAYAAVTKALELDPSLAEAHTTLAALLDVFDWDWARAEREYKRAIELNPNYVKEHDWYSLYLAQMGRTEEAIRGSQADPGS